MTPGIIILFLSKNIWRINFQKLELLQQRVYAFVTLIDTVQLPSIGLHQFPLPPTRFRSAFFPATLPAQGVIRLLGFCQSDRQEMISLCTSNLHFSYYKGDWTSCHMFMSYLYFLFSSVNCVFLSLVHFSTEIIKWKTERAEQNAYSDHFYKLKWSNILAYSYKCSCTYIKVFYKQPQVTVNRDIKLVVFLFCLWAKKCILIPWLLLF